MSKKSELAEINDPNHEPFTRAQPDDQTDFRNMDVSTPETEADRNQRLGIHDTETEAERNQRLTNQLPRTEPETEGERNQRLGIVRQPPIPGATPKDATTPNKFPLDKWVRQNDQGTDVLQWELLTIEERAELIARIKLWSQRTVVTFSETEASNRNRITKLELLAESMIDHGAFAQEAPEVDRQTDRILKDHLASFLAEKYGVRL